jgi:hypothetical protein
MPVHYRESDNAPLELWPALLAAVTRLDGTITGILAPGSIRGVRRKHRSPIRAGRSAICSATACASAA